VESSIIQGALDLGSTKWPELMNEANARVELGKASDALLDGGHSVQDFAYVAAVAISVEVRQSKQGQPERLGRLVCS
jgi:hypothetical protein